MMKPFLLTATLAISLAAATSSANATTQLVTNGGFETGDLTGWTVSGPTGAPQSCQTNWTVATTGGAVGCGGDNPGNPIAGTYAVYTSNDGGGPLTYSLSQSIFVPLGTASGTLSFDWTGDTADANRQFSVVLDGTTLLSTTSSTSDVWTVKMFDVSSILASAAGTSISLQFSNYIPGGFTGCCNGMGVDAVSLTASATVPEPASIASLSVGLAGLGAWHRRRAA